MAYGSLLIVKQKQGRDKEVKERRSAGEGKGVRMEEVDQW